MTGNSGTSVCEVLDRLLNTGVVVAGVITIAVADIDLLYLDLHCLLSSIKNMNTTEVKYDESSRSDRGNSAAN